MDVRPSRSPAPAEAPAAAPVTNARAPEGTEPSCFGPSALVEAGSERANAPAALVVAVSVPSGFVVQPAHTSRSSSKAPQRAVATAALTTASGHDARSMAYRTASRLRPVSLAILESSR